VWARAIIGATVFACACGRLDFATTAGTNDAEGDTAGDSGSELCVDVPPTDTCADFSGFHRIQAVPSTCPEGTNCQILENVASASQPISEGAGHLLVVFAYGGQNPGGSNGGTAPNLTFTVSDTLGNTYLPGPFVNDPRYDDSAIQIFYATNIAGGQNTVSVAESAPQTENFWTALVLLEYDGVATTNAVDTSSIAVASGSTTSANAGNLVTRASCDLVVGAMANGHVINAHDTPGPGFAEPILDEWDPAAFLDNVATGVSAGTAVSAQVVFERGADDGWVATQLAFRASTSPPMCQPVRLDFATPAQAVPADTCSGLTTIASVSATGAPTITAGGVPIELDGSGVTFYADAACAFPINRVVIGAGASAASFYFRAANAGAMITAKGEGYPTIAQ
jgi:hypothetical protein